MTLFSRLVLVLSVAFVASADAKFIRNKRLRDELGFNHQALELLESNNNGGLQSLPKSLNWCDVDGRITCTIFYPFKYFLFSFRFSFGSKKCFVVWWQSDKHRAGGRRQSPVTTEQPIPEQTNARHPSFTLTLYCAISIVFIIYSLTFYTYACSYRCQLLLRYA